jgi:hypothetical protein
MPRVHKGRYVAHMEGDFVVFLVGMRINRPWKIHKWWPTFRSMSGMIKQLRAHPEKGALGSYFVLIAGVGPAVIQYWRSFEHLEAFARGTDDPHIPAWRKFNQSVKASGDVGIWHETYQVRAGESEGIYANMPRTGLALAGEHRTPENKGQTAAHRIGRREEDEPAVPTYSNT